MHHRRRPQAVRCGSLSRSTLQGIAVGSHRCLAGRPAQDGRIPAAAEAPDRAQPLPALVTAGFEGLRPFDEVRPASRRPSSWIERADACDVTSQQGYYRSRPLCCPQPAACWHHVAQLLCGTLVPDAAAAATERTLACRIHRRSAPRAGGRRHGAGRTAGERLSSSDAAQDGGGDSS